MTKHPDTAKQYSSESTALVTVFCWAARFDSVRNPSAIECDQCHPIGPEKSLEPTTRRPACLLIEQSVAAQCLHQLDSISERVIDVPAKIPFERFVRRQRKTICFE